MTCLHRVCDGTTAPISRNGVMRGFIGDSLCVGGGDASVGLGPILTDTLSWVSNNYSHSGSTVADLLAAAFNFGPVVGDQYIMWLATNDKILSGDITNRESSSFESHLALLLQLASKEGSVKVSAQSATAAGTWANSVFSSRAFGKSSATNGSTLTFTVSGTTVAVQSFWENSNGGTFSVTIDGVGKGSFSNQPPGNLVVSNVGATVGPAVNLITGLASGSHTVVITVTSATNVSNNVYIGFVAGYVQGASISATDPLVVAINTQDFTTAGNTAQSCNTARNTRFKTAIAANVATALGLGLNVKLVDADALLGANASLFTSGGIHPNETGYNLIKNAVIAAIG